MTSISFRFLRPVGGECGSNDPPAEPGELPTALGELLAVVVGCGGDGV